MGIPLLLQVLKGYLKVNIMYVIRRCNLYNISLCRLNETGGLGGHALMMLIYAISELFPQNFFRVRY